MSRFSLATNAVNLLSDDDQRLNVLREELEEELHKIDHLERSQNELRIAIEEKQDRDFLQAIRENNGIINAKRRRVAELHEVLLRRDPAYRAEPYLAAAPLAAPIVSATASEDDAVVASVQPLSTSTVQSTTEEVTSTTENVLEDGNKGGIYL